MVSIQTAAGYVSGAAVLFVAMQLAGCAQAPAGGADTPVAGEIRVVSVTPVGSAESRARNLILNGYFDEWWAGAPAPSGFTAPVPAFSTLRKVVENGKIVCVQEWVKSDNAATSSNLFRVIVVDTKADTPYELSIQAYSLDGGSAFVSIYENPEAGAPVALTNEAITIEATDTAPKAYTAVFKTKQGGKVSLIVRSKNPEGVGGKIAWISWSLTPGASLVDAPKQ